MSAPRLAEFVDAVGAIVGRAHVLTQPDLTAGYEVDWTGRFRGRAAAVVRPADTGEVAAVVGLARTTGTALVAQGGNTGLVGGATPQRGEVVVSLRRLDHLGPVDATAGQVTAGAGATIAALQRHAGASGWDYGVDWGARDSATVGGSVATNAAGLRFVRHGGTRRQLLGIEAVLGTGDVVSHLGGLEKDNTGYDLAGLLCGSEGTLGLVTAARLRLVAPAPARVVALLAFADVTAAVASVGPLRRTLPGLEAAELFLRAGLDLVRAVEGLPAPFRADHAAYLLVEVAGVDDPTAALAAAVDREAGAADVAVAVDAPRRAALWRYREAHTEAINTLGPPHKLDVTLPLAGVADFVDSVSEVVARVAPTARTWLFGHAADGNIHVNVTGLDADDDAVDDAVLRDVVARGGTISAEHGIGTAKRRWLELVRSTAEIASMRAVKAALDPDGILNPAALLGDPG